MAIPDLLRDLLATPGPSGREGAAARVQLLVAFAGRLRADVSFVP